MKLITKYFPKLDANQISQLEQLEELYTYWNQQINLISRKDIENFYERHVLHSLAIGKLINFRPSTKILDVGTGGGFPGIPLSILFPEANFTLVDSIGKKIKVVNEVIKELQLTNAKGIHANSKNINDKFDFIVSRAVTSFDKFMPLVRGKISKQDKNSLPNGILYLKGGDLTQELRKYKKSAMIYPIKDFFKEEFFETKHVVYISI